MTERETKYYRNLEKLLLIMSDTEGPDMEELSRSLGDLCVLLRICKGVTEFYSTLQHEKIARGEVLVGYDDGTKDIKTASHLRIVTPAMAVVNATAYMKADAEPLDEWEQEKVDLVMRTVLNYVSRQRLQKVVEKLTFYDDNGFENLKHFFRDLNRLNRQGRLPGMAAVHFNLKHFSMVNQDVGRSAGNIVMRNYYNHLKEIIGSTGVICRIGGDNFALICDREYLQEVLSCMRGLPVVYDNNSGKRIMVSSSAGVYLIPEDSEETGPDDIMDKMISASTSARKSDRDDILFYSNDMAAVKEKAMRIQRMLPMAMKNEEFKVFYQPKINIDTGSLIGAEALCRWFHDGEIIPPSDFIPLLEQSMDICALDFYMLDHVCADIRRWLDEGQRVVRVSVNLSRKHMIDVDLMENIIEIVDRHQVPHEYVEIELTETTTDVEFRDLKRVVSGLQQAGIYTSVDDFGMGYSSLNLIRAIPWNVLKVDRSFLPVNEDTSKSVRSIMFKYVVAMAKELGLECIAEGVETSDQVNVLRDNECELAQGFFFDRPLPLDEFEKRLRNGHYQI